MVILQDTTKQTYRGAAVAVSAAAVLAVLGLQGPETPESPKGISQLKNAALTVSSGLDAGMPAETAQAMLERVCLSGLAEANSKKMSVDARLEACDRRIENSTGRDRVFKVLDRARLLHFKGKTEAHKQQAYMDFSLAIAFGIKQPSVFAARGKLNHMLREDPAAAIADYDRAISLANGTALPSYYLERAKCKVAFARQNDDMLVYGSALQDVDVYLKAFPDSRDAKKMRGWLVDKVQPLVTQYIRPTG